MKRYTGSARVGLGLMCLSLLVPPSMALLLDWSVFSQAALSGLGLLAAGVLRRPTHRSFIHGTMYLAIAFLLALVDNIVGSKIFSVWLYAGCATTYWIEVDGHRSPSCNRVWGAMKRMSRLVMISMFALLSSTSFAFAQQTSPAARFEGSVDLPFMKLGIIVTLQKTGANWTGTINIPSQAYNDAVDVLIENSDVTIKMRGVPGDPIYKGKFSEDGRLIAGDLTQSGRKFPFTIERLSEAESAARQKYGATPEKGQPGESMEGNWQGTIAAANLRLVLKLSKATDGSLSAKLDSPDQGTSDLQVDTVALKEKTLRFEIKRLGASFEGTLSQDGSELSGTWEQQGAQLPLILKRLGKK
jgi:hypothetical protein